LVAVALQLLLLRWNNPSVLPSVLLATMLVTHLMLPLTGASVLEAQDNGWMFQPPSPAAGVILPWQPAELRSCPWETLPCLVGELLAVIFVTVISLLINTTGIEIATKREADIERELNALGLANLLSGALGGLVSCLSLSRSTLNHTAGATGRISGLTLAAISA